MALPISTIKEADVVPNTGFRYSEGVSKNGKFLKMAILMGTP
jgi:hypothetical protein